MKSVIMTIKFSTLIILFCSAGFLYAQSADVYADAYNGWNDSNSTGVTIVEQATTAVSGNAFSLDFGTGGGAFQINTDAGVFATSSYGVLTFSINGGPSGGQDLEIELLQSGSPLSTVILSSYLVGPGAPVNSFESVSIPLSDLGALANYIDAIVFRAASDLEILFIDNIIFEKKPAVLSILTLDVDSPAATIAASYGNGLIETVELTFNNPITDPADASTGFTVAGLSNVRVKLGYAFDVANDNKLYIIFDENASFATDATPDVSYDNSLNPINDAFGQAIASFGPMPSADGAKPSLVSAISDLGLDMVEIEFSEPVYGNSEPLIGWMFNFYDLKLNSIPNEMYDNNGSDRIVRVKTGSLMSATDLTDRINIDDYQIVDISNNFAISTRIINITQAAVPSPVSITSYNTFDEDGNGYIDAIEVVCSESVNDGTINISDFYVAGVAITGFSSTLNGSTAGDNKFYIQISPTALTGGRTPLISYTQGGLQNSTGQSFPSKLMLSSDKVRPVILTATTTTLGISDLVIRFSEPVWRSPGSPPSGNVELSNFIYNQVSSGVSALASLSEADGSDGIIIAQGNNVFTNSDIDNDSISIWASNICDAANNFNIQFPAVLITEGTSYGSGITQINEVIIAPSNAYVDVYFDAGVYDNANGPVTASFFTMTFNQNSGTATNATITGITGVSNQTLVGGECGIRLLLSITGTPNGDEDITITPVASSIYNYFGEEVASTSVTSNKLTASATGVAPVFLSATTGDMDGDGKIDQITLKYDSYVELVDGNSGDGLPDLTVAGYTIATKDHSQSGSDTLTIDLVESASVNTEDTPLVSLTNTNNSIVSIGGGIPVAGFTDELSLDGVGPRIMSARTISNDVIEVTFTEDIDDFSVAVQDFYFTDFNVGNGYPVGFNTGDFVNDDIIELTTSTYLNLGDSGKITFYGLDRITDTQANNNTQVSKVTVTNTLIALEPVISTITTADINNNGILDRLVFVFDKDIDVIDGNIGDGLPGISLSQGIILNADYAVSGSDTLILQLDETDPNGLGTGVTPDVSYDNSNLNIQSSSDSSLAQSFTNELSVDGVGPVIVGAITTSTTSVELTFSEIIQDGTFLYNNVTFSVLGTPNSVNAYSSASVVTVNFGSPFGAADTGTVIFSATTTSDVAGNFNIIGSNVTIENGLNPEILSAETRDLDADGQIDAVYLVFSEAVEDASLVDAANFTIGATTGTGIDTINDTANNDILIVTVDEGSLGPLNTSQTFNVSYTSGNLLGFVSGLAVNDFTDFNVTDRAGPAIVYAETISTTAILVRFSEAIDDGSFDPGYVTLTNFGPADNWSTGTANDYEITLTYLTAFDEDLTGTIVFNATNTTDGTTANGIGPAVNIVDSIGAGPSITGYEIHDSYFDGALDELVLTFNSNIDVFDGTAADGLPGLTLTAPYTIENLDYGSITNVNTITLVIENSPGSDTGTIPDIAFTNSGSLRSTATGAFVQDLAVTPVTDGAGPAIVYAETISTTAILLRFSEAIDDGTFEPGYVTLTNFGAADNWDPGTPDDDEITLTYLTAFDEDLSGTIVFNATNTTDGTTANGIGPAVNIVDSIGAGPSITGYEIHDSNFDGALDELVLTFASNIDVFDGSAADGLPGLTLTAPYTIKNLDYGSITNVNTLTLVIENSPGSDTGAMPDIAFTNSGSLRSTATGAFVQNLAVTPVTDGAGPAIVYAETISTTTILVRFSEAIVDGTFDAGYVTLTNFGPADNWSTGTANDYEITLTYLTAFDEDLTGTIVFNATNITDGTTANGIGPAVNVVDSVGAGPSITGYEIHDSNFDGALDELVLTFASNIDVFDGSAADGLPGLTLTVPYTIKNLDYGSITNVNTLTLVIENSPGSDTGTMPDISFTNSGSFRSTATGAYVQDLAVTPVTDVAGPAIVYAETISTTAIMVRFSEAIADGTFDVGYVTLTNFGPADNWSTGTANDYEITLTYLTAFDEDLTGTIVFNATNTTDGTTANGIGPSVNVVDSVGAGPSITGYEIHDSNFDGALDELVLTFDSNIDVFDGSAADGLPGLTLTAPYTIQNLDYGSISNVNTLTLVVENSPGSDTDAQPDITFTNSGSLRSTSTGAFVQDLAVTPVTDGAGPAIVYAETISTTKILVRFSEAIVDGTFDAGYVTLTNFGPADNWSTGSANDYEITLIYLTAFDEDLTGTIVFNATNTTDGTTANSIGPAINVVDSIGAGPSITGYEIHDSNYDGALDELVLTFDANIDVFDGSAADGLAGLTLTGPYTIENLDYGSITNVNTLTLVIENSPGSDTGAMPDIAFTSSGSIRSTATGAFVQDLTSTTLNDQVGPAIVYAETISTTAILVRFSEAIADGTFDAGYVTLTNFGPADNWSTGSANDYEITLIYLNAFDEDLTGIIVFNATNTSDGTTANGIGPAVNIVDSIGAGPSITGYEIHDSNYDGALDELVLTFDANIDVFDGSAADGLPGLTLTGPYTIQNLDYGSITNVNTLTLVIENSPGSDTGIMPVIAFTNSGSLRSTATGAFVQGLGSTVTSDAAGPAIVYAETMSTTKILVRFSEAIDDGTFDPGYVTLTNFGAADNWSTGSANDYEITLTYLTAFDEDLTGTIVFNATNTTDGTTANGIGPAVNVVDSIGAGPSITGYEIHDSNYDGALDELVLTFDSNIDVFDGSAADGLPGLTLTAPYTIQNLDYGSITNANTLTFVVENSPGSDTDAQPDITFTNSGSFRSTTTGAFVQDLGATTLADNSSPVLISVSSAAQITMGNIPSGSSFILTFSEDISLTSLTAADFKVNTNGANPDSNFDGASLSATAGPGSDQLTITLTSSTTSGVWDTNASLDFDTFTHVVDTSPSLNPVADNGSLTEVPITGLTIQLVLNILSRTTLDTNGNGFIDTIDLVFDRPVNDDFSDITATVAGYNVSAIDTGINGALNDTISVHLVEGSVPDSDAVPAVRITANTALRDNATSNYILNPEASASSPVDGAAPVVVNTLAAAGGNRVKMDFSEYVYSNPSPKTPININGFDYIGNDFDSIFTIDYKMDGGIKSAYFHVPNTLTADNVMTGSFTVNAASVYDTSGNEMTSGLHELSALALNVITPVFLRNESGDDPRQITAFNGTAGVYDTDLRLQANIEAAGETATVSSLYVDADVAASSKVNNIWLPGAVTSLLNKANSSARNYADGGAGSALREYLIPGTDSDVKSGSTLEFLFMLGAKYCLQAENPDKPDVLKLYSFKIQDLVDQGGGVTILNNVIQPSLGDEVEVVYNVPRSGNVTITIFDLSGRVIDVLQRGYQEKGEGYRVFWNGLNRSDKIVASGLYFVKIVGPDIEEIRKVLILK